MLHFETQQSTIANQSPRTLERQVRLSGWAGVAALIATGAALDRMATSLSTGFSHLNHSLHTGLTAGLHFGGGEGGVAKTSMIAGLVVALGMLRTTARVAETSGLPSEPNPQSLAADPAAPQPEADDNSLAVTDQPEVDAPQSPRPQSWPNFPPGFEGYA